MKLDPLVNCCYVSLKVMLVHKCLFTFLALVKFFILFLLSLCHITPPHLTKCVKFFIKEILF